MSKLLKSKFLLGTLLVLVMFGGFAATTHAQQAVVSASDIQYAATVRQGSVGQSALIWQKFFNGYSSANLVADSVFGPLSSAAAKVWQASRNLAADGVLGAASRASAIAQINSGVVNPVGSTYPAGCSSFAGYSVTTGLPCTTVGTLPAGCTSTAGYSSTTGVKCDNTTPGTPTGPLVGGAGDITLSKTSTDVEDTVLEGATQSVLGFKIEATDSDVAVKNVKVTLLNQDLDSSYRLNRYADKVSIYMGSTKLAEADAADFTKNNDDSYSKSFALDNAIVREGSSHKATFYVKVSAVSNIDTGDDTNDWNVEVSNIRFQDATGVVMTNGDTEDTNFTFEQLSTSGDVKLTVSKGSGNPTEGNVEVSDTTSTSDVLLLQFKLKATGTDMDFDRLTVNLDNNTGYATNDGMIQELVLKNGSDELASIDGTDITDLTNANYHFDLDDSFPIAQDATETFSVYAKIGSVGDGTFANGDDLRVSYNDVNMEDVNGDAVDPINGSATGEYQYFYSEGISTSNFTSGTASVVTDTDGYTVSASWPITFKVTAFGNPYYIKKDSLTAVDINGGTGGTGVSFADLSASNATEDGDYWLIEDGDTATFTTTGVISVAALDAGFYRVTLDTLVYDGNGVGAGENHTYTFTPSTDYQTSNVYFNPAP